jgi:hypothetical protein
LPKRLTFQSESIDSLDQVSPYTLYLGQLSKHNGKGFKVSEGASGKGLFKLAGLEKKDTLSALQRQIIRKRVKISLKADGTVSLIKDISPLATHAYLLKTTEKDLAKHIRYWSLETISENQANTLAAFLSKAAKKRDLSLFHLPLQPGS